MLLIGCSNTEGHDDSEKAENNFLAQLNLKLCFIGNYLAADVLKNYLLKC